MDLTKVKETYLTFQDLISEVSEYDIYAYYLGEFNVGEIMTSPFRKDKTPSFGVYLGYNGVLMYKDFRLGSGNCVMFVQKMENVTWHEAMNILNERYDLRYMNTKTKSKFNNPVTISTKKFKTKQSVTIQIRLRKWEIYDKEYWFNKYEIKRSTLELFNVFPIQRYIINGMEIKSERLSYAYYFEPNVFKIYQPYNIGKMGKWISNIKNTEIYQGEMQLADISGEILFITSSLKDVMVLYEAGYCAIAPHTEAQLINHDKEIFTRFKHVIVFYDNDEPGIEYAEKTGLPYITLPDEDTKDPSDFVEKYSIESLKEFINETLEKII
jgi:hypothetical protein